MVERNGEARRNSPTEIWEESPAPAVPASTIISDEARWLLDLLWSAPPHVAWGPVGTLPARYRRAERLVLLPSGAGKTFSVSLGSRRGAFGCVTAYGRLRPPRRRVERAAVGVGLLSGVLQTASRQVEVAVKPDTPGADDLVVTSHLKEVFDAKQVIVGCSAGSGPYRKPVLQVFDGAGRPLGYVKIGWNEWTRAAVEREADALERAKAATRSGPLGVPSLLSRHEWNGLDLVVTSPLPRKVRRIPENGPLPPIEVLARIVGLSLNSSERLVSSSWWSSLRARAENNLATSLSRSQVIDLIEETSAAFGPTVLPFGMSHGDLSPWNLGVLGDRTYAWDFESSCPSAPVGLDPLHFVFQAEFVARGTPVAEAAAVARERASEALQRLGVARELHGLVSHLHLLEQLVQHEEAHASTGVRDERFAAQVVPVLRQALARSEELATATRRPA